MINYLNEYTIILLIIIIFIIISRYDLKYILLILIILYIIYIYSKKIIVEDVISDSNNTKYNEGNIILELKANKNKEVQDTEINQLKKYLSKFDYSLLLKILNNV